MLLAHYKKNRKNMIGQSPYSVSNQPLRTLYWNQEAGLGLSSSKAEMDSFSEVFPQTRMDATCFLRAVKNLLNLECEVRLEKLPGGDCNQAILISKMTDSLKIPFAVLKREPNGQWGEKRMRALDEIRMNGFDQLPKIFKDQNNRFLFEVDQNWFSCIEYIKPDRDQPSSLEEMFMLTSDFHKYARTSSLTQELRSSLLDSYSTEYSTNLDPEVTKRYSAIFEPNSWEICVKCAEYFKSDAFRKIYEMLPKQVIHGDITPFNTIVSGEKPYLIDLDTARTDIRLYDFATFLGWNFLSSYISIEESDKLLGKNFLDRYLSLEENSKFSSCIQTCYGGLEEIEREYLSLIVLFGRCNVLHWMIKELKEAIQNKDVQKEQRFASILPGAIREINELYHRIPKIKEIVYFHGSSQKAKISSLLSVPKEIAAQLNQRGVAVIYGAPASGKSQQMEMAVPASQTEVFNLAIRFPEVYSLQTGRKKDELAREYILHGSHAEKKLKEAQKRWLQLENPAIVNELAASKKKVIVFDEFDFAGDFFLSPDEVDGVLSIVQIGERLRKLGKQVVFLIRSTANLCQPFWDAMQTSFGYQKKDAVRTRFFTYAEENSLLSQTYLDLLEKQEFMSFAQGSPTAYLPLLKQDVSIQYLKDQASMMTSLVIKHAKVLNRPDIWDLLVSLAHGNTQLEEINDPVVIEHLLASGFVGQRDGRLVMGDFAKEALCS